VGRWLLHLEVRGGATPGQKYSKILFSGQILFLVVRDEKSAEPFCGAIFVQALWLAAWLAIGYAAVPDFPDGAFIHG